MQIKSCTCKNETWKRQSSERLKDTKLITLRWLKMDEGDLFVITTAKKTEKEELG